MKRTAQHDAGDDDDDDWRRARSPPVIRVSSMSGMSQAAAPDNDSSDRRRIPRVIRNAIDSAPARRPPGYSPAVPFEMATAHCWARYDDVVAVLRALGNASLLEEAACADARATLRSLYQYPTPFGVDARFPEAEVFLSVDHGRFGQCMSRIQKELLCVEAATSGYRSQRLVATCGAFMAAVNYASDTVSLMLPDEPGKPVLYDRAVFEEAFQLTWTD